MSQFRRGRAETRPAALIRRPSRRKTRQFSLPSRPPPPFPLGLARVPWRWSPPRQGFFFPRPSPAIRRRADGSREEGRHCGACRYDDLHHAGTHAVSRRPRDHNWRKLIQINLGSPQGPKTSLSM